MHMKGNNQHIRKMYQRSKNKPYLLSNISQQLNKEKEGGE